MSLSGSVEIEVDLSKWTYRDDQQDSLDNNAYIECWIAFEKYIMNANVLRVDLIKKVCLFFFAYVAFSKETIE